LGRPLAICCINRDPHRNRKAVSKNSWNSPETRPFSEMGFVV
jgi:hypothetical protein